MTESNKTPNKQNIPRSWTQRAQSLTEFALILPLLLLVLLGIIEFARILQAYLTVQHAARVGARYAVTGQFILLNEGPDGLPGTDDDVWASRSSSIITTTHNAAIGLARVRPDADVPVREPRADLDYYYDVVLEPLDGGVPYGVGITDTITVTVHYNVPLLTPLIGNVLGDVVHVTGRAVMQNESFNPTPGSYVYTLLDGSGGGGTGGGGGGGGGSGSPLGTDTPTPTATPVNCSSSHTQINIPGSNIVDTFTLDTFSGIDDGDVLKVVADDGSNAWTYTINFAIVDSAPRIDQIQIQYPDSSIVYNSPAGLDVSLTITNPVTLNLLDLSSVVISDTTIYDYGDYPDVNILDTNALNVSFTTDNGSPGSVCLTVVATPPTVTPTPTSTPIPTSTPAPTDTPTPTSTPQPIALNEPLNEGDTTITGTGQPGLLVTLRDFSRTGAPTIGTGTVQADGAFSINVTSPDSDPALVSGHIIVGNAGNSADSAIVIGGTTTPTATPTATATAATPSPTPTPTCSTITSPDNNNYTDTKDDIPDGSSISDFTLSDFTGMKKDDEVKIKVESWTGSKYDKPKWEYTIKFEDNSGTVRIKEVKIKYDDGSKVETGPYGPLNLPITLNLLHPTSFPDPANDYNDSGINVSSNNRLTVELKKKKKDHTTGLCLLVAPETLGATPTPAPTDTPTPTPTPLAPDLFVAAVNVAPGAIISAGQSITVEVVVENGGSGSANSLSWTSFYLNPTPAPPASGQLGDYWTGISSLAAGSQITLTYIYSSSYTLTNGAYPFYVQVDTWDQLVETNENNNIAGPVIITVTGGATTTTPTPTSTPTLPPGTPTSTPTSTPEAPGSVSGATWLLLGGDLFPIGHARIEVRSVTTPTTVVDLAKADALGNYNTSDSGVMDIPPGAYDIYAEVTLNGTVYSDVWPNVQVVAGTETPGIILILY